MATTVHIHGISQLVGDFFTVSITESLPALSETKVKKTVDAVAESLSLSETVIKKPIFTEAETITNLTETLQTFRQDMISESITLSDSTVKKTNDLVSDTLNSISETAIQLPNRVNLETVSSLTEVLQKKVSLLVSEPSFTFAESIVRIAQSAAVDIFETMTALVDSAASKPIRSVSESLTALSETIKEFTNKKIAETITLSESISTNRFVHVTETITTLLETAGRFIKQTATETLNNLVDFAFASKKAPPLVVHLGKESIPIRSTNFPKVIKSLSRNKVLKDDGVT